MKKIIISCLIFNIIILILTIIIEFNVWTVIDELVIIIAMLFILFFCKDKTSLKSMCFFSVWVTVYGVLYLYLKIIDVIDLYEVSWRVTVQLFVPFLVVLFTKRIKDI
jgi:hypothetical protein